MQHFWIDKPLQALTPEEWESLCDGCGKCCLVTLEDETAIHYTQVACEFFNPEHCSCTQYRERQTKKPNCVKVTADNIDSLYWLPDSCAYRLVARGQPLPSWHHLISGSKKAIHKAGFSMQSRTINESLVDEDALADFIIQTITK